MNLNVTVDDFHIQTGFRQSPCRCPVQQAVVIALPIEWDCRVYDHSIDIRNSRGSWITLALPAIARAAIRHYDLTGEMAGFKFELWIPDAMFL